MTKFRAYKKGRGRPYNIKHTKEWAESSKRKAKIKERKENNVEIK